MAVAAAMITIMMVAVAMMSIMMMMMFIIIIMSGGSRIFPLVMARKRNGCVVVRHTLLCLICILRDPICMFPNASFSLSLSQQQPSF